MRFGDVPSQVRILRFAILAEDIQNYQTALHRSPRSPGSPKEREPAPSPSPWGLCVQWCLQRPSAIGPKCFCGGRKAQDCHSKAKRVPSRNHLAGILGALVGHAGMTSDTPRRDTWQTAATLPCIPGDITETLRSYYGRRSYYGDTTEPSLIRRKCTPALPKGSAGEGERWGCVSCRERALWRSKVNRIRIDGRFRGRRPRP